MQKVDWHEFEEEDWDDSDFENNNEGYDEAKDGKEEDHEGDRAGDYETQQISMRNEKNCPIFTHKQMMMGQPMKLYMHYSLKASPMQRGKS